MKIHKSGNEKRERKREKRNIIYGLFLGKNTPESIYAGEMNRNTSCSTICIKCHNPRWCCSCWCCSCWCCSYWFCSFSCKFRSDLNVVGIGWKDALLSIGAIKKFNITRNNSSQSKTWLPFFSFWLFNLPMSWSFVFSDSSLDLFSNIQVKSSPSISYVKKK